LDGQCNLLLLSGKSITITKNPLSLGIIGLMEVIPAVSMALFAGHIVDQKEKLNLLAICIAAFSLISLGLFLLTWPRVVEGWSKNTILYSYLRLGVFRWIFTIIF